MHKEVEQGVEIQGDHTIDECEICKFGLKHGGLVKDYEGDRRSSKYVIIANLIGIYTVGVCPSIPYVLAQCGWFGIFVIIFSGWVTWYSSYFLVKSLYSVEGHRLYDFTALGTHFFGYWTGKLIRVFTHIIQILSVGALVISILDNLKILFSNTNLPALIDNNFAVR
jgi:amino acid permease